MSDHLTLFEFAVSGLSGLDFTIDSWISSSEAWMGLLKFAVFDMIFLELLSPCKVANLVIQLKQLSVKIHPYLEE